MAKQNKMIFSALVTAVALTFAVTFTFLGDSDSFSDTGESVLPEAFSQEFNSLSKNNPTIKVTGEA